MTMHSRTGILLIGVVLAWVPLWAQAPTSPKAQTTPVAAKADPPASSAGQPAEAEPIEPPGFTYNPDGRRDPFVSLIRRGTTAKGGGSAARPSGLAGLEVAEVMLRGTVRSREGFVAILQGSDQKAYIVRAGDRLFDGTVRTISQNDMVILQQVNDPLSLEKQREVRKVLRQIEAN
jgi:Tfp pilus assembly protein PilP